MANRRNEFAGGLVDGINAVFTTSTDYRSGTLTVQVNGQALIPVELGGVAFQLANPPKAGDQVSVRFTAVS
jgi:hypothetical protein